MLQSIEDQMNNLEEVRSQLFEVKKLQLHSGLDGFNSPDAYATYKSTGGDPLGVVGRVYEPADLHMLFDSFTNSIDGCLNNTGKVSFDELRGGARVHLTVQLPNKEVKASPMKGDVLEQKIILRTGFDGLTKTSLTFHSKRLWCTNGAANWEQDMALSLKNTINNHVKIMLFCDELIEMADKSAKYVDDLSLLCSRKITQADLDKFLTKLTGFDVATYKDLTTKRRNILDRINESVAIESQNTGWTEYSLLQGITRYTTHELCGGNAEHEDLFFSNAAQLNQKAHALLLN